jgi:hypothetical protein
MGNLCTLLSSRNKVAPQTETISLMDRTITSLNTTIVSQEEEISNHENVIAMQETTIASLESEISEANARQEATIAGLESEISCYKKMIVRQDAMLCAGDAKVQLIRKELALLYTDIEKKISSY